MLEEKVLYIMNRNRPDQEMLVPDWLITTHVRTGGKYIFLSFFVEYGGRVRPFLLTQKLVLIYSYPVSGRLSLLFSLNNCWN